MEPANHPDPFQDALSHGLSAPAWAAPTTFMPCFPLR